MEKLTGTIKSFTVKTSFRGSDYEAVVTPDNGGSDITIRGSNLNPSLKPGEKVTYLTTTDSKGNRYYTLNS